VITTQLAAQRLPREPGHPAVRLRWALIAAVAGGLLLTGAFPPFGFWPLAAVGPAVLVLAIYGRGLRASFLIGLVFGLAFFTPLLCWLINLAWYAWIALAIAESLILGVLTIGQRLLLRLPGWPLAVAGWWVLVEGVRDRWPWGFPWGRLAMSQANAPTKGWTAVGGAPLLSFLVALAGGTLAWLVLTAVRPGGGAAGGRAKGKLKGLAVPALSLVAAAGLALAGGALPVDPVGNVPTAVVAAIQGNVPRATSLVAQLNDTMVTQNHADATITLAREVASGRLPAPDLVIWPENSTDLDPGLYPSIYDAIAGAVAAINRPVLVGAVLQNPLRNAGQLWLPGRGPVAIYVKRQLVPFGEYIPFRGLLSKITSLTQLQPVNFTPGHNNVVFRIGKIRLGDAICYEIGFDNLVRSDITDGANLLTEQTNDATFERDGQVGETEQQLAIARIRAVESDRAVVVASTTGISAIIAPDGRLITSSDTWRQAILEARVPLITHRTLADQVGPWPEYVIIILTVLACAAALFRRPGAGRPGAGRPDTGRPGAGRPGASQAGAGQPGTGQLSAGQPGAAKAADQDLPDNPGANA
jgi:apolipoprotein N-acyltransferase